MCFDRIAQSLAELGAVSVERFLDDVVRHVHTAASPAASCVDDIEQCCAPRWVPFFDAKSTHKQGCALRVALPQRVVRVYLCDPTHDTYSDAKGACAKAAVSEGVLDLVRHGNPQPDPGPSSSLTTPWTLQAFYDSLPRPFPESFHTNNAAEINAPAWLNTTLQSARGGKLVLSFFFTSDGPPGLHGCLLKIDRPGEYRASLVDARFPKRSDAKAAVCLQAMSDGIGDYIRSIAAALDARVSPAMRSFSSSLVYPALTSELSKIEADLVPLFEYVKERDAFGATLIVRLSSAPEPGQVRRYSVPTDYRNKADAKVGVICHAAEQGAVEFVRFRGGDPPNRYQSPYNLQTYDPNASRKRKQPGSTEDSEQDPPPKKRTRTKRNKRRGRRAQADGSGPAPVGQPLAVQPSGDQIHGSSGPGDMGLSQNVSNGGSGDPSQPGVGGGGGSSASSYSRQMYALPYPAVLDQRFGADGGLGVPGYPVHPVPEVFAGASHLDDTPLLEGGPSRAMPGSSSRMARRRVDPTELEPGEVVSSAESDFSESSSRNEEVDMNEREADPTENRKQNGIVSASVDEDPGGKGKRRETSPANTSTTVSRDAPAATTASHVQKLIDYCATHDCGTPSFHEAQRQGRYQVWIIIGKERFDLPSTYGSAEEGRQRVAKQVLARLYKG